MKRYFLSVCLWSKVYLELLTSFCVLETYLTQLELNRIFLIKMFWILRFQGLRKKAFQVKLTVFIRASVNGSHTNKEILYFLKDSLTNRIGPFIHSLNTRLYISCDTILDCDKSCALCLQHYCPSFPRIWKTKQKKN